MTFAALLGGLTLVHLAAPNDTAATTLRWSAPAGCPTQDDVAATLAAQVTATEGDPVPMTIDAVVRPTADARWHVDITIVAAAGEQHRALDLDSCAAAAEAVALVHGLARSHHDTPPPDAPPLELPLPDPAIEPPPTPAPTTTLERTRDDPRPPPPPPPPRRDRRPDLLIHIDAGGGIGTLPRGGGHLMLGIGPAWKRVQLGLRLDHTIVRRIDRDADGIGARLSSTTGGLELELPIELGRFTLLPGVELRVGGIRARGIGGRDPRTRWVPWIVAAAGFGFVWEATRIVGLRVAAAVEVPLARHTFVFDDVELDRTRRVGGRLVLGLEFRVPRRPR